MYPVHLLLLLLLLLCVQLLRGKTYILSICNCVKKDKDYYIIKYTTSNYAIHVIYVWYHVKELEPLTITSQPNNIHFFVYCNVYDV